MGPIAPVAWTPDSSTIVVIERVRKDLEKAGWQHLMTRDNVQFSWNLSEVSVIFNALYRVPTIEFFSGDTLYQKVAELNCVGEDPVCQQTVAG